ncbi:PREDICTED: protocadherin Fat 4-like, partial [Amphimedon queenslandica]
MDTTVKNAALDFTDNFSTSAWLKCNNNNRASQYVFSFDNDNVSNGNGKRTFTWRIRRDNRLTLFYTRGRLDNIPASQPDSGENSRVGLSFYFQSAVSTTNICDGGWHFYKLDITYPSIKLFVDGYVHYVTEGHYHGVSGTKVDLNQITDGSGTYDMPARLNTKTNKNSITGRIGSSSRFLNYGFNGELRLLMMTSLLDNSQYTCLASCNNSLVHSGYSPGTGDVFNNTIGSFTNVFYQPVSRTLYFSNAGGSPSEYTAFLRNISYNTNGHLPAQTVANMGEGRRIELQLEDEVGFGSLSVVNIYARSNQHPPEFSASGDTVSFNYSTTFTEGVDTSIPIVSTTSFLSDDDLDPVIESATIILTNPQLSTTQEFLAVSQLQQLETHSSAHNITITGTNTLAVYQAAFITSLTYNNLADEPHAVPRVIQFSIFDGRNYNYPLTITTIQINTINDAPNVYPSGVLNQNSLTFEFNEGSDEADALPIAPDLIVSDSDDAYLESAFAGLSQIFDEGDERIYINLTVLSQFNITCLPASCAGQNITLSGHAPTTDYQSLLRSVTYINDKKPSEFPSLFDRIVNITVSDGNLTSSSDTHVLVDIIPVNPRVIIDLDTPSHNYSINYDEDSFTRLPIAGALRWVDISLNTLLRMVISIRNPDLEAGEQLIANDSCIFDLGISADDNLAREEFTFGLGTMEAFLGVIDCLRYQNTEPEPKPVTRYIDFTFIPGGGAPSDSAVTIISITHINDNTPECNTSSTVILPEETSTGSTIHTLQATDSDLGGGHDVLSYSLISNWPSLFGLSTNSSGIASITLFGGVDYDEGLREYPDIIVQACDVDSQCCNFTFSFELTDANDNPPVFVSAPYSVNVLENLNTDVLVINFTDIDSGVNAQISSVSISSIHPASGCMNRFEVQLNSSSAVLRTINGGLDFETQEVCYVYLEATDGGQPSMSSSTNVTVMALNQDDRSPVFLGPNRFEVEEDNQAPLVLGTLMATDPDTDNTQLVFAVHNTVEFSVTSSGTLSILFSSNYSVAVSYPVEISVTDPAGNSVNAMIIIDVLPINNDPPELVLNNVPVAFVEESNAPVTLNNNPSITDPDNVTLTITRITAVIANGESSTLERLSVASGAPSHVIASSSNLFELLIIPTNPSSISEVISLLQSIQYINREDEPSPCRSDLFPCTSSNSRTIRISVFDGVFNSSAASAVVTFSFVNDAPVIDLDTTTVNNRIVEFTEGDVPAQIPNEGHFSISDDDDTVLSDLICSLFNAYDGSQEMLLAIGSVPDSLTVEGNGSHSLRFNGNGSVADFSGSLSSVYYYSSSANPNINNGRLVNCTLSDGKVRGEPALAEILFMKQNNLPIISLAQASLSYTEGQATPVTLATNSSISDADDTNLASLSITYNNLEGRINFTQSLLPAGVTSTSDCTASTCSLSISGSATISQYTDILHSITYSNNLDEFNFTQPVVATFVVTDPSGNRSEPVTVTITHIPVDDNPPSFTTNYTVTVSETTAPSTIVATILLSDNDLPTPQVPVFSIVSGNVGNKFSVGNNPLNPLEGLVRLQSSLDFDVNDFYQLTIRGSSGGFAPAEVTIFINVMNVNNKDVVFINFPSNFTVYESNNDESLMPPFVSAIDPDGFPVSFSVDSPYVSINQSTGRLRLSSPVDRETVPGTQFTMNVTVSDGVSSETRSVIVIVLDVNEFSPVFNDTYTASVTENALSASPLLTVFATDADEAPDLAHSAGFVSRITYSLGSGPFSTHFSLNSAGALTLVSPLDYEATGSSFNLSVIASDNYQPNSMSTTTLITISVSNVNDEAPYFINFASDVYIFESPRSPASLTVRGDDPDINSQLVYSIDSDELASIPFTINSQTGIITVPSDLDVDSTGMETYPLVVTLTDLNTDPSYIGNRAISLNYTIYVSDVNDNSPSFTATSYSSTVIENTQVGIGSNGIAILTVRATDADYGFTLDGDLNGNNNVTYSLHNEPSDVFAIDPITGIIYKLKALDREHREVYQFYVEATDNPVAGDQPNVAMAPVTVTVLDENEHAPVADPSNYTASLLETASVGSSITTNVAVEWSTVVEPGLYLRRIMEKSETNDADDVLLCQYLRWYENGSIVLNEVTYLNGVDCINSSAEVVWTQYIAADLNSTSEVELTLPLSDDYRSDILGAYNAQPTDDTYLRYLSLNTVFTQSLFTVSERTVAFYSPMYIQALNGSIANGTYRCQLNDGASIQPGVVYNTIEDFEYCSLVDGGFNSGGLASTFNDTSLWSLTGFNGRCSVFYGFTSDPVSEPLVNDTLSVGGKLFYRLGDTSCTMESCLPPSDFTGQCNSNLGSNAPVTEAPLNFSYYDPDGLKNTAINFSLVDVTPSAGSDLFSIHENDCVLSVASDLNPDQNKIFFYVLSIRITDQGGYYTDFPVSVTIEDVNDNSPIPSQSVYTASINENLPASTLIPELIIAFTDADSGDNARLSYSLEPSVNFTLSGSTSTGIYTNRMFDYETDLRLYTLTIRASDAGTPTRQGMASVVIEILDLNDNRPLISAVSSAVFTEGGSPVTIASVSIIDVDSSQYLMQYALITIDNALDSGESLGLSSPLPSGFNSTSDRGSRLLIYGEGTTQQYASILSTVTYENTQEELTSPSGGRQITFGISDLEYTDGQGLGSGSLDPDWSLFFDNNDTMSQLSVATVNIGLLVVNDQPSVNCPGALSLPTISEDVPDSLNGGANISSVNIASVINDNDNTPSSIGVAVVSVHGDGTWQFRVSGTSSFTDITSVSTSSSVLLAPDSIIRFKPNPHSHGSASFNFKAWDRSNGLSPGTVGVDTTNSASQGNSSFSADSCLVGLEILPVNDGPVVDLDLGGPNSPNYTTNYTENQSPSLIYLSDINDVRIIDEDHMFLQSLTVTISKSDGSCDLPDYPYPLSEDYLHPANLSILGITQSLSTSDKACRTYTYISNQTASNWEWFVGMLRLSINNTEPSDHTRRIQYVISDGEADSSPVYSFVSVSLVSDNCPSLSFNISSHLVYPEHGSEINIDPLLSVVDEDYKGLIEGATIRVSPSDSSFDCSGCLLEVSLGDTVITSSYSNNTLTLQGQAEPEQYQKVLRTLTFRDTQSEPTFGSMATLIFDISDSTNSPCSTNDGEVTIVLDPVNDLPVDLALDGSQSNYSVTYTEDDSVGVLIVGQVEVDDPDTIDSALYNVTVTISEGFVLGEDRLIVVGSLSPATLVSSTHEEVVIQSSLSHLPTALRALRYININTLTPSTHTRWVRFSVSDDGLLSDPVFTFITVVSTNDPPSLDLDSSNPLTRDSMVEFDVDGPAVDISPLATVTDPDGTTLA